MHSHENGRDLAVGTQWFEPGQFIEQEEFLLGVKITVSLRAITVQTDYRDKGGVESEENAWLDHRGA